MKNYSEKYFQNKVVEQRYNKILDLINLMLYHAKNTSKVLFSIKKNLRHYSKKISKVLVGLRQNEKD